VTPQESGWKARFNEAITDAELSEGQQEFEAFNLQSKEELFYIRKLAQAMDISRVPHLRDRAWISFPVLQNLQKLKAFAHFSL
jgi:asparagine synthase (glutamine-hydrolysing)